MQWREALKTAMGCEWIYSIRAESAPGAFSGCGSDRIFLATSLFLFPAMVG